MSRRPGIAAGWFDKYADDVYPSDNVHIRGKAMRPPKFYDRLMEQTRPYEMEDIKAGRVEKAKEHAENNTPERLEAREKVQKLKLKHLPRNVDKDL